MSEKHRDVILSWRTGDVAYTSNLLTDGRRLFSFQFCIGVTDPDGAKVGIIPDRRQAPRTTMAHVNLVKAILGEDRMITIPDHYYDETLGLCSNICEHVDYPSGFIGRLTGNFRYRDEKKAWISRLIDAAQNVVDRWDSHKMSAAVNELDLTLAENLREQVEKECR